MLGRYAKKMTTSVLQAFLRGEVDEAALSSDLRGTSERIDESTVTHKMEDDCITPLAVQPEHLAKVCDAFISDSLSASIVEDIGFALMASDAFEWDSGTPEGAIVARVSDCWCSPEIEYRITPETMIKFRSLLLTGEDHFDANDLTPDSEWETKTRAWNPK
jgi:hypothetical protein